MKDTSTQFFTGLKFGSWARIISPVLLRFRFALPVALALVASVPASAGLITVTTSYFGNIPTFNAGTSATVTASQFNQAAVDASITAACPAGDACSAATLIEIDETLTVDLSGSITVNNISGSTKYIAAIQNASDEGSFGSATSGVALTQTVDVALDDPYQSGAADAIPVQKVKSTNQFKGTGQGTGTSSNCAGTATSTRWINCLAIPNGGNSVFTGTATGTGGNTYLFADGDWTNEEGGFLGTGDVSFTLDAANGTVANGTYSSLTFPSNSASIQAGTNGLEIDYTYTYDESVASTPEPMTLFLAGSGLLGLAVIRKRRSR